jgi:hypothetical protein
VSRALSLALLALVACQADPPDAGKQKPAEPSPNASILPAPLSSELVAVKEPRDAGLPPTLDGGADAGAVLPPSFARDDTAFELDSELRDLGGIAIKARFRWLDLALPSRLPEANLDAVERARNALSFDVEIELSATGRLRFALASDTFVMPRGTELRARSDVYGHAVIWPDSRSYAVLPPGTVRSALNERRADAIPLARPKPIEGPGPDLLGLAVERQKFTTQLGRLDLDQAHLPGSGFGGPLLCRLLLELVAASPESSACSPESVPLRAEYSWTEGGKTAFEVLKWTKLTSVPADEVLVPPRTAAFKRGELPPPGPPLLLDGSDLARFRLRPSGKAVDRREQPAVKEGLLVVNRGELAGYLLIDGAPVLRAEPRSGDVTLPLIAGTYSVGLRDFLGSTNLAPSVTVVPTRVVLSDLADSER